MTKPLFAGEPSMEDILTSIRKMISEEPAGPRPVPDQIGRTVFSFNVPEAQQPAAGPQQGSLEDNITRLLIERPGPTQGPVPNSRPLAALSGGRDPQAAAHAPGRASAFEKPVSQANDARVPFGHRAAEARPFSTHKSGSTDPSLDRTEPSVGAAEPFGSGAVGSKSDGRSALEPKDATGTKPAAPKVSSLVANLEKARASAPAPEAVAAALLDKSGTRLSNADSRSPAANGATISPFGSPQAQSEASRADASVRGAAAKPGSASPPSEVLLDAVVDLVKNDPSSLSVFTSGSAFINGVADGEKPGNTAAPPRKLDTAASELIRPMLRQWLSENMPRIVEEALRSELDSGETTGEGTDKA